MNNNFLKIFTLLVLVNSFSAACTTLPDPEHRPKLETRPTVDTKLSQIFSKAVQENESNSGFVLIRKGDRALHERLLLADIAEQSIDAQYYIWNSDKSGKLLLKTLIQAADRGVSVRILLDDFNVGDRDDHLLVVNEHPHIQVRIYNPFLKRSGVRKWFNFAWDFDRLNRRMHNKTYIVDGAAAITGGRNIGDEYFDQNPHINFSDLDVLSIGPVVEQVSASFEDYWNSPWAIPVDRLLEKSSAEIDLKQLLTELNNSEVEQLQFSLSDNVTANENHFQQLLNQFVWAQAVFIQDDPNTGENKANQEEPKRVAQKLFDLTENSKKEVLIESAYFVLGEPALKLAGRLQEQGVRVFALTNSMASNDVLLNHASYSMVRKDMLEQGIELYELRPDASSCLELIGRQDYCDDDSHLGLHSKSAVFDRKIVYIGSLNINLRSAYLNSEVGMIIHSPVLALQLAQQIEQNMLPVNSWQAINENNKLQWVTVEGGEEVRSSYEPRQSWMNRIKAGTLTLLPGAKYY